MAHQENLVNTQMVNQPHEVADDVERRVGRRRRRRVAVTEAPEVRSYGSVPQRWQSKHLVAPRVPELWEAMEEENRWTGPDWSDVHVYAVCFNRRMLNFLHCCFALLWSLSFSLFWISSDVFGFLRW